MWAVIYISLACLGFGIVLAAAAVWFRVEEDPLVDKIDSVLPQTQCGQCGYPGCRPYAQAIAGDQADINQCPPGGEAGIQALADLLGKDPKPLNPDNGEVQSGSTVAFIHEAKCIGCTKCIQACPVDAIIGAARQAHTVVEQYCTGCDLCLPPICPVDDCIEMRPVNLTVEKWKWPYPSHKSKQRATG